jgi:serine/threonine protein phosphatase PrpC
LTSYRSQQNLFYNNNNNIKQKNSKSKSNSKNKLSKSNNKYNKQNSSSNRSLNKLTRSESFSILRNNKNNLDNINSIKDINVNKSMQNINPDDINNKRKHKVIKKIYKIESICQKGYSGPGIEKFNQDNFFVYNNLNDENNVLFIGVCDGHGILGHDVSKYLITHLPSNLNQALKKTRKYIRDKKTLYKTMKEVFIKTNNDLCKNDLVDTQFSGSTCVTIILTKNQIISGNVGDSRAVMGRYTNGQWINIDLTKDQKPDNPEEKERIIKRGGRIEAYKDENGNDFGPKRVWLKTADIPGLAMSRSFGDEVAASVGTISEPEIKYFDITDDDKFIIIASDGIWEFISSKECVNIIKDFYLKKDLKGCLKYLLNESSKRWIKEEEVIDDITCVLIFFED